MLKDEHNNEIQQIREELNKKEAELLLRRAQEEQENSNNDDDDNNNNNNNNSDKEKEIQLLQRKLEENELESANHLQSMINLITGTLAIVKDAKHQSMENGVELRNVNPQIKYRQLLRTVMRERAVFAKGILQVSSSSSSTSQHDDHDILKATTRQLKRKAGLRLPEKNPNHEENNNEEEENLPTPKTFTSSTSGVDSTNTTTMPNPGIHTPLHQRRSLHGGSSSSTTMNSQISTNEAQELEALMMSDVDL